MRLLILKSLAAYRIQQGDDRKIFGFDRPRSTEAVGTSRRIPKRLPGLFTGIEISCIRIGSDGVAAVPRPFAAAEQSPTNTGLNSTLLTKPHQIISAPRGGQSHALIAATALPRTRTSHLRPRIDQQRIVPYGNRFTASSQRRTVGLPTRQQRGDFPTPKNSGQFQRVNGCLPPSQRRHNKRNLTSFKSPHEASMIWITG
jgi:hypothetical protein